jgi:hypothetical protein
MQAALANPNAPPCDKEMSDMKLVSCINKKQLCQNCFKQYSDIQLTSHSAIAIQDVYHELKEYRMI